MPNIPGSVPITGFIAPTDAADTFATQDEAYNRGGYRSVADIAERDAITPDRRKEGMLVNVLSDSTVYKLTGGIDNVNWEVDGGGSEASEALIVKILQRYTDLIRPPTVVFDGCESVWDGSEPVVDYNDCEDPNLNTEELEGKIEELCGVVSALVDTEGISGTDSSEQIGEIDGNEESCIELDGGGA